MFTTDEVLNAVLADSAIKIKESLFRKKFLPLVFSDDPTAFDTAWLHQVTGSPTVEVLVVADNDSDRVYFTVPPLREHIDKNIPDELPEMLDIIDNEAKGSHRPEVFVETNVVNVIPISMKVSEESKEYWTNVILPFYKIVPPPPKETTDAQKNVSILLSDEFDDDY